MSGPGHNSQIEAHRSLIQEIIYEKELQKGSRLKEKELYQSVKDAGFDVQATKDIVKDKMMEPEEIEKRQKREERKAILKHALGWNDTPLGQAAMQRG